MKIHEICGEAGTGKTNLMIFTMVKAAINRLNCLYISINHNFPEKRLSDFLSNYNKKIIGQINFPKQFLFEKFNSINKFRCFLDSFESFIIENSINIIFLDSIAALLETEFIDDNGNIDIKSRNGFLN